MKSYLISYDLGTPETRKDYANLIAYIKTFTYWATPLKSVWFVKSDLTAEEIRDRISVYLDTNDKVMVIEVKNDNWGTRGVLAVVTEWMKSTL